MNDVEIVKSEEAEEYHWLIKQDDKILGRSPLYATKKECLASLFSVYFAEYDNEAFMKLYSEWQSLQPKDQRITSVTSLPG